MSFDSCIATTSGCVVSKICLSSSTVLLMPFALNNFYLCFCFGGILFVACVGGVRVWGAGVGAVRVATYGSLSRQYEN